MLNALTVITPGYSGVPRLYEHLCPVRYTLVRLRGNMHAALTAVGHQAEDYVKRLSSHVHHATRRPTEERNTPRDPGNSCSPTERSHHGGGRGSAAPLINLLTHTHTHKHTHTRLRVHFQPRGHCLRYEDHFKPSCYDNIKGR